MSIRAIPEWVDFLVRAGQLAPSADNSQPWRFVWDGKALLLFMDEERGKAGLGLDHPANLMAMGAVIENLAQAAASLGMPADVLTLNQGNAEGCFAKVSWDGSARVPDAGLPLGLVRRHTNRGPFRTEPLHQALILPLTAMKVGPVRTLVVTGADTKKRWTALVRAASEVRFQTEEIHRWLAGSLRFTREAAERGEGLDVATLLLPPGGRWLLKLSLDWQRMKILNRFGAFKLFALLEAAMLQQCSTLVLVTGPVSGMGVEVAAGRLIQRVWIAMNERGIAVHPYYVLPDQLYRLRAGQVSPQFKDPVSTIKDSVADLLGSRAETIYMLLRVGLPKIADPVRSRRLPVDANLTLLNPK